MAPKVSICIPAFDQTELLLKNLQSVADQSFKDYEVIISDDTPTEKVESLVKDFFSGRTIKYTYHRNQKPLGSPANWNKAISFAGGKYIKLMHHDDWFRQRDSLARFVEALDKNPEAVMVFSDSEVLDMSSGKTSLNHPDDNFIRSLKSDPLILFNNNRVGSPSAVLYRANKNLAFDEKIKYLVDVDFYIRLLQHKTQFVYIQEALIVNTSHHPQQVTAASMNKAVQIGEYSYLYNKLFNGKFPAKKYRRFFKELFSWYKLNSFDEIVELGYEKPRPEWMFKLIFFQSKLTR